MRRYIQAIRSLLFLPLLVLYGEALCSETLVSRDDNMECGIHCAYLLEAFYGANPDLDRIRTNSGLDSSLGASVAGLRNALEMDNFIVTVRKYNIESVTPEDMTFPFIAHVRGQHYLIVYAIHEDTVYLADVPDLLTYSWENFLKSWEGISLSASPPQELPGENQMQSEMAVVDRGEREERGTYSPEKQRTVPSSESDLSRLPPNLPLDPEGGYSKDHGLVEAGDLIAGEFVIRNTSDSGVRLERTIPDCSCTSCTLSADAIEPGASATLRYEIDTANFARASTSTIHVVTNRRTVMDFYVTAQVVQRLRIEPPAIDLGVVSLEEKEPLQAKLAIHPTEHTGDMSIDSIDPSADYIELVYDRDLLGRTLVNSISVLAIVKPTTMIKRPRKVAEEIRIKLRNAKRDQIAVPVRFRIDTTFEISPNVLFLGNIGTRQNETSDEFQIEISSNRAGKIDTTDAFAIACKSGIFSLGSEIQGTVAGKVFVVEVDWQLLREHFDTTGERRFEETLWLTDGKDNLDANTVRVICFRTE